MEYFFEVNANLLKSEKGNHYVELRINGAPPIPFGPILQESLADLLARELMSMARLSFNDQLRKFSELVQSEARELQDKGP